MRVTALLVLAWAGSGIAAAQAPGVAALVEAVRPALPFPAADARGEGPADGSAAHRWFVIWPADAGEPRIVVRANPYHPEVQAEATAAMSAIQDAVMAAERRAQAAYDRAMAEVRRTGRSTTVESISLDDEGAAGERIDANLELTIGLELSPQGFEVGTSEPPVVSDGPAPVSWMLRIPANTYREGDGDAARERFRAAEARLYVALPTVPAVSRIPSSDRYTVTIAADPGTYAVVLRGNASLLDTVLAHADWSRLGTP